MKDALYCFLHGVFLLDYILIFYFLEWLAFIFQIYIFLHFVTNFLEPNIALVLNANLKVVA
jgi:hypothetical protein